MSAPEVGIVCIGASTGGLRSLEALLAKLPENFPWPILVSQHLQPDHASMMPQLLARISQLQVREAVEGDLPEPGVVYTGPSDLEMGLSPEGHISMRAPVARRPQRIDHLFATASFAHPGLVIAIVLSGTGSDGAAGSLVVKLNGGTVIAESPESALESAMPEAASRAGTVDDMRSAEEMAPLLVRLSEGGLGEMTAAKERELRAIAQTLTDVSGTDFAGYRLATLRRRIEKRRTLLGIQSLGEYATLVRRDASERDALVRTLLIPVTEFFRDPEVWVALSLQVGDLVARARDGGTIDVWCAGCATGEEAYTCAIALIEAGVPASSLRIVGTDLDAAALERARRGLFSEARMTNVDATRRERFFKPLKGAFEASDELRGVTTFRVHDLTRDPLPTGPLDLIVCRNVLIYFDDTLREHVLSAFEAALTPRALLLLGRSEALPRHADVFEAVARSTRLYRTRRREPSVQGASAGDGREVDMHADESPEGREEARRAAVRVEESSAIILALDAAWRITLANRRARETLTPGIVGMRLLDVFPHWQGSPVHSALRTTRTSGRSVRVAAVPTAEGFFDIELEMLDETGDRSVLLVARPTIVPVRERDGRAQHDLHEDLETTNAELQTANEELAAANEELQASNEELASLNEEFLSTNQNLASTNAELQAGAALASPTRLLQSMLLGERPMLTCDATRRVITYTPKAAALLGLDGALSGRELGAADLGIAPATLDAWLVPHDAPVSHRHATARGELEVGILTLRDASGKAQGWLFAWADPDSEGVRVSVDPNMTAGREF